MQRRDEKLFRRDYLDQLAGIHHAHPVDRLRHQAHVVPNQDHRRAQLLLHALQRVDHLPLDDDVERAGRLIGNNHLRLQANRNRDADPLFHATAQLVREHVGDSGFEPNLLEQVGYVAGRLGVALAYAVVAQPEQNLVLDPLDGVERVHRPLRHHRDLGEAHPPHLLLVKREQIGLAEQHRARLDPPWRPDHPHQRQSDRRLTAARLADEAEALAACQPEGDAVDGFHRPCRRVVVDAQVFDVEHRCARDRRRRDKWTLQPPPARKRTTHPARGRGSRLSRRLAS